MAAQTEQLLVRQHERLRCDLSAWLTIAPEHAERVVPARGQTGPGGRLAVRVTDVSLGGIGVRTTVFLPRLMRARVFIQGAGVIEPSEWAITVQRVVMVDRTPTYDLGTSLTDPGPGATATAQRLIELLRTMWSDSPRVGGGGRA